MEKNNNINWDDIAGLEFAKKTINEIIIWPMLIFYKTFQLMCGDLLLMNVFADSEYISSYKNSYLYISYIFYTLIKK